MLDSEAGRMLVPVVNLPLPPNIRTVLELSANDSSKTLTVPDGKQWKILYGAINFTTSATVGNRRIRLLVSDSGANELWIKSALNVQTASLTERYSFQPGGVESTEDNTGEHIVAIPTEFYLSEGFTMLFSDVGAVDAAADDMLLSLVVEETDLTDE